MLPYTLDNFLHSLLRHVETGTSLKYTTTPRAIFRNQIHEAGSVDAVLSVFRIYGGEPTSWEAVPNCSIQVESLAFDPAAALARAEVLFKALLNAEGRPVQMLVIDGYNAADEAADGTWRIIGLDVLQRPGVIGLDPKNRNRAVFNFDVDFVKLT